MNKLGKRIAGLVLAASVAICVFAGTSVQTLAYTQTTGKVTSDNVKVRESASTTAKQVSSLRNGDSVDIVDEATDASGYVWYKIYVNKSEFGYVRSDLVAKAGGSSSSSTTTSNTASLPETSVTGVEQKSASVIADSVNVRKGAGTAYDSVGKVTKNETVTITGEATGTDNKTWYQVNFGDGKTGFIRGDLVTISDAAPVENTEGGENAEGENPEGEQPAEGEENQEASSNTVDQSTGDGRYSLVYVTEEEGTGIWYLYDNEGGYRVKVNELIEAAQSAEAVNQLRKTNKNFKRILIFLAILIAALIAGIAVLALKLRDSLYYEDEDEEEEYDRYSNNNRRRPEETASRRPVRGEEERPSRRVERENHDEEPERPARRPLREASRDAEDERPTRRPATTEERTVRPTRRPQDEAFERPSRRAEREDRAEEPERPARRPLRDSDDRPSRRPADNRRSQDVEKEAAPKRRARNFLGDDDDFEFEFLDLDDEK